MRKGRFAGLGGRPDAVEPLGLIDLLLVDLLPAGDQYDERIGIERVRSLTHSALFLMVAHLACGIALLACGAATSDLPSLILPLTGVLLFDVIFWFATRRERTRKLKPHLVIRLAALYVVMAGALWSLLVFSALDCVTPENGPAIRVALSAGFALPIAAFLPIPSIVAANTLVTIAATAALYPNPMFLGIVTALGACFSLFSLYSARDSVLSSNRRLATEWQAEKARRFVVEFEQSGRGWFWETNADGALSYVSDQLAEDFDKPASALLGRQFADLLRVEENEGGETAEPTLGFHLSARFPFSDVTVRANTHKDIWWSLSGSPNFDTYGRFLGFRGIGTDLTEQRRSEAEISRLARFDSLTGLPNRVQMRQMLEDALRNAAERRRGCSLFLIDLDRFKNVNDTLGHPAGDELLRQVAQRLTRVIGEQGQVGRLGGDEFKAVLPGLDDEGRLGTLANCLIHQVSKPYMIDGHNVTIGASVGIAIASPRGACADALIRDADLALYAAKAAGRGTHCFFAPEMHSDAKDRQILENDLRNAITREELKLLFQPQVNSVTEDVVGFEALLRWEHPTRGRIMPEDFVPLAEECGLIAGIGAWVLRTACAEAAKWPDHVSIAVNLSPLQFTNAGLPGVLMNALASAHLDPGRLELEITESVFLEDSPATDETFAKLKALGVRLVLDDFGTGYSSLGYLRKAPFDKIKIDQSFVRGAAEEGSRNAAIVRAIVAMAEGLGMETTAEGAETADELALIRQLGCSQIQGYIFGRPMDAEQARQIASKAKSTEPTTEARAVRHGLIRLASLNWEGQVFPVRLRNISSGGALLESERGLAPGAHVELDLAGCGLLRGEVRWSQAGRLGLRFDEEFDMARLAPTRSPTSNVKVLRPNYLDADERSEVSPLVHPKRDRPTNIRRL
ncbi:MAG: EAL domain-containing protein [Pseudomonadota bacterium]|nr:EAL domain-containing protein [Pseudomonadota bacterium]